MIAISILRRLLAPLTALFVCAPLAHAADTGYAAANNSLYRINMSTGAATLLGASGITSPAKIEGLAMNRAGELYAVTNQGQLLRCAPDTGACTGLGSLNVGTSAATIGLAFAADGQLYVGYGIYLLRADPANPGGRQVLNNNLSAAIAGLAGGQPSAACASGLYALGANGDRGKLYCVNPGSGSLTQIPGLIDPNTLDAGLDANPLSGLLWGITSDESAARIYSVDPATLTVSGLRNVTLNGSNLGGFESLAIAPSASSNAVSVPTLAPAIQGALALLLGTLAFRRLRRRNRAS